MATVTVSEVVKKEGDAISFRFSDGSQGTHHVVKNKRGFLNVGAQHTLTPEQWVAVSKFNEVANKPDGGWL